MKKRCVPALYCLLLSCASPHEGRDAVRLDGDWQALMGGTDSVQLVEGLRFDCSPFTDSFFMRVQDGVVAGFLQADENYSFTASINDSGYFKATIPTNSAYTYKDAQVRRKSAIVLVLEGSLSARDRTGVFVIGDRELGGQGCKTDVRFVSV